MRTFRPCAALVTGANRGIGRHFLDKLAERYEVVIAAVRNATSLQPPPHNNVKVLQLDVADLGAFADFGRLVEDAIDGRRIQLLVNNAGVSPGLTRFNSVTADQMEKTFRVNVIGPLMLAKTLLPLMRTKDETRRALIVNLSSTLGSIGLNEGRRGGGIYPYRVSKSALNMLTRSFALDLKSSGVDALALHPGWVKTALGGPNAPLEASQAVDSIFENVLDVFDSTKHNGGFFDLEGQRLPW